MIILPEKQTRMGAAYFCACLLKPFDRSAAMDGRGFYKHSSKIRHAQNGGIL